MVLCLLPHAYAKSSVGAEEHIFMQKQQIDALYLRWETITDQHSITQVDRHGE